MMKVIMAIVLGAAFLSAILWLPVEVLGWLVLALVALGLVELTRMKFEDAVERWTVIVVGLVVATVFVLGLPHPAILLALTGGLFVCALVIMWRAPSMEGTGERLGFAALAMLYISIALPFWFLLRVMDRGEWWVLLALVPACLCDTFAFLAGKAFGKRPFAPKVSPNKTVEGFFGALVGSAIGTAVVVYFGGVWLPIWHAALIALAMWWVSPMGDLIESMLKRSCGVKDSGTIIRGHGGVLDRLDALIFAGPMVYVYAKYIW